MYVDEIILKLQLQYPQKIWFLTSRENLEKKNVLEI